jgi:hypothetical protein
MNKSKVKKPMRDKKYLNKPAPAVIATAVRQYQTQNKSIYSTNLKEQNV